MELKDICTDLEYAKKLKELGVKQDSLFYWRQNKNNKKALFTPRNKIHTANMIWLRYSAFTSTELLELLPNYIGIITAGGGRHGERCGFTVIEEFNEYLVRWGSKKEDYKSTIICEREKLCNALAKMLIYLIENKLMEF